jgi:HK97 family phage major capsid protein
MKDFLNKIIADKTAQRKKLSDSLVDCESKEQRSSIMNTLSTIDSEISEARAKLAEIENEERKNAFDPSQTVAVATMTTSSARSEETDELSTMEYRTAFMNYVQKGVKSEVLKYEERGTDATGIAGELGVLIPSTVVQEIIKGVEKVYGQLYSRVRKTNLKGGVSYPIGTFGATFSRITETTKSDRQKGGEITGEVTFSYKIGEIRLARTLLQSVLTVPAFEQELSKVLIEAYVKAMDTEIMVGTAANNQCIGILTEANNAAQSTSRFYGLTDHIIEFTEADMADWKSWQKKLFAKIPLSMRGLNPEFVMTANTYESNIKTITDDNNRPVYNETFNPVDGTEISRFKGKDVVFVENDILGDFDDIDVGQSSTDSPYFGMYWVPDEAYAINSNLEFTVTRYFDHETNQWVDKALVINDGKILDPKYIYLLKKVASVQEG